jgi:nucleoid-associated protein YgaU
MDDKTKGIKIFDQMLNAVSSRDEKADLEAAKQHMLELEQQVAANAQRADAAERKVAELQTTLASTQAELTAAKASAGALERRATMAEARVKMFESQQLQVQQQAVAREAAKAQIIATHTLTADETLSHLALKYYGHATKPYWTIIYEANKDVIGPNPNKVRPGLEIQIPVLPDNMKK